MINFKNDFPIFKKRNKKAELDKYFFKKVCLFLGIVMFCISCHSYRSMNVMADEIRLNKKYKITTKKYQKKKVIIKDATATEIIAVIDKTKVEIPVSEIEEIRRRKFSYVKTLAIPVVLTGFFALAITSVSINPSIGNLRFPN
ncbi:hypothetical protein [Aquimarina sp. 2201CG5-10]|uniref:hypothetical protein n=1 Tax=Aquimarina callyspongiae TaxID=3098150 RepID=UPI002AB4EEBE|nr:hypothetical protein [Aquimarina sp. 2201CG5-10]MDY8138825.1 hypothetical protein [Aquimarina sp. 2201CG5-10]